MVTEFSGSAKLCVASLAGRRAVALKGCAELRAGGYACAL
jgi:hypothetical protein